MNGTTFLPEDMADEESYELAKSFSNPKAGKQFLPKSPKPMPARLSDSSDDNEDDIFRSNDSAFNFDKSSSTTSSGPSKKAANFKFKKPAPYNTKLSRSFQKSQNK